MLVVQFTTAVTPRAWRPFRSRAAFQQPRCYDVDNGDDDGDKGES